MTTVTKKMIEAARGESTNGLLAHSDYRVEAIITAALAAREPASVDAREVFTVKHYGSDERPTIKGNGFDGLEIGTDREEAEEFVTWLNAALAGRASSPAQPEPVKRAERVAALREAAKEEWASYFYGHASRELKRMADQIENEGR